MNVPSDLSVEGKESVAVEQGLKESTRSRESIPTKTSLLLLESPLSVLLA